MTESALSTGGTGSSTEDARDAAYSDLDSAFDEVATRFRRLLADAAEQVSPGMLPAAYKVFLTIARRDSITSSTLADLLDSDKGYVSRLVRDVEERGLVQRSPDPADRRAHLLTLTPAGRRAFDKARAPREKLIATALEEWALDDVRALARLLHALAGGHSPDDRTG